MPNEQSLKLRKILQDIRVGEYVQFLYPELSKKELEKNLKNKLIKTTIFILSPKGNQKLINIYTTKISIKLKTKPL